MALYRAYYALCVAANRILHAHDLRPLYVYTLCAQIQLGGANDALCHFLSLGGLEFLLDCGLPANVTTTSSSLAASTALAVGATGDGALHIRLPALHAIDVASLDVLLLSNHHCMLALPFVTEQLGFQGAIYATELTLEFGRVLLDELATAAQHREIIFEFFEPAQQPQDSTSNITLRPFTLIDVARSCAKVTCIEYKEVLELSYGVSVTALSSGFSLGASTWLIEGPNDRLAYVPAASGDLNRHPKELDLLPLVDCETLLLTDLKPDRDPHASTERMVERLLTNVSRVLDRGGVCVVPCSPTGVLFDLVEAIYVACVHTRAPQSVPMYFVASHASQVMTLTKSGAEWLCEKKIEKLYAGENAFLHETLVKSKILNVEADLTPALASVFQNASIVFVGHPSLQLGLAPELIRMIGADSRNALLLIDPSVDPHDALLPFQALEIEKIACPIDPRLSCGDANQFIARCCPKNLIVPLEYTLEPPVPQQNEQQQGDFSHFSRVLPLHELTAAKPKMELVTVPMRALEPIVLDKSQKYIDGKLDPSLAAQAVLTEVSGKAAAYVSGVLSVKRKAFVLEAPSQVAVNQVSAGSQQYGAAEATSKASGKRKAGASNSTMSPSGLAINGGSSQRVEYRDKSAILLGQVDEDKLERQVKAHDPNAQVYISQGQGDADVFMSIPSLDARITLWKETAKTVVETEKEDARALLTSLILAQLVVIPQ